MQREIAGVMDFQVPIEDLSLGPLFAQLRTKSAELGKQFYCHFVTTCNN